MSECDSLTIDMKMFGTNGIRGIANEGVFCPAELNKIGMCIAKILGPGPIAIAKDTRISSDMIMDLVSAGIMSMGVSVYNLGLVPTPALQYYVKTHDNIAAGVMITASHNPPEFNGVKCISNDGTECSSEEESAIEDAFDKEVVPVSWDKIGCQITVSDAGNAYIESIISKVDTELIRNANLKICMDCANGASVHTTPELLRRLGVKAVTINASPDGMFPGHHSEPVEKNLGDLIRITKEIGADFGAAHDGDADRCMFVTGSGRFVGGDITLALMSKYMASKSDNKNAVTTVATSAIVEDVVRSVGGKISYTAVGSPKVARRMMEDGSIVGGEENGGFIFADHQYCRDGAMCIARMLEFVAKYKSLDAEIDKLPKYCTIKGEAFCEESLKSKIAEIIAERHSDGRINKIDGLRIDYDDGWVLLRASGTEPKYRIYSESKDKAISERRAKEFKDEFESIYNELKN